VWSTENRGRRADECAVLSQSQNCGPPVSGQAPKLEKTPGDDKDGFRHCPLLNNFRAPGSALQRVFPYELGPIWHFDLE
jgi:hypothetical protein